MSQPVDFSMKVLKILFGLSLLCLAGFAASGCATLAEPKETAIPWSRPQSWEHKVPGMGM
jgi:hypothetical protein